MKIARGRPFEPWSANNQVAEDVTGTNLSKITIADPFPVYNRKVFEVLKNKDSFQIQYKGPLVPKVGKLFFIMLLNNNHGFSALFSKGALKEDLREISCDEAIFDKGITTQDILCFSNANITIARTPGKAILLMEFEVHTNYKGIMPQQPTFVNKNPLFETEGIRLLSVAEFKY